jgi:hypothetical protein
MSLEPDVRQVPQRIENIVEGYGRSNYHDYSSLDYSWLLLLSCITVGIPNFKTKKRVLRNVNKDTVVVDTIDIFWQYVS